MKKKRLHLPEVLFPAPDRAGAMAIYKMMKKGVIRKIATRIYTSNLTDPREDIVKRNLFIILRHLYPRAVISHRSALEFQPTPEGHIFMTYPYSKNVLLPGITVHLIRGSKGTLENTPHVEGLRISRLERAFLENMQISKKRGEESKTLPLHVIREKLKTIVQTNGEEGLKSFRYNARKVAENLHMYVEFERLNDVINTILFTRASTILKEPTVIEKPSEQFCDLHRLELFHVLFTELQRKKYDPCPDRNTTKWAYRNFAFFESYFSNYIDGVAFELNDARRIIETEQPMLDREEDSHDILETFRIVSNQNEMKQVPQSADEFIYLLKSRHRRMLFARSHPTEIFRDKNMNENINNLVDYNLIRGTLTKGFEIYQALEKPFAKAVFMLFMIREIQPFPEGSGRIARIMMNAELTSAGESKIIIPTAFRNDYLLALWRFSKQRDPKIFVYTMERIRKFSSNLYGEDAATMEHFLRRCYAFDNPEEGLKIDF
jgi:hypothetical protein